MTSALLKKSFEHKKERGQARLPDLELIRLEVVSAAERLSSQRDRANPQNLEVGKAGLPPPFNKPSDTGLKPGVNERQA